MNKKIARELGASACIGLELLANFSFILDVLGPANSRASPGVISEQQHCRLRKLSIITVNTYLIMHKQLLILHLNVYRSHCYNIVIFWSQKNT